MKKYRPSMAVNRSIEALDQAIQERARKSDDRSVHSRQSRKSHKSAATTGNFDSGSIKSRRSSKSAATTGHLQGRRKTKYREGDKPAKRESHDPDGVNMRSTNRSESIDPPTEIRVVESAVADWKNVSSKRSSLRDSKSSFSLGKMLKSESVRKKLSSTGNDTDGDPNSKSSRRRSSRDGPKTSNPMRLSVKILRAFTSKSEDTRSMPSGTNSRRTTHYRAEPSSTTPKRSTQIIKTTKAGRGLKPTDPTYADVQSLVPENDLRRIRKSTFQPSVQNEVMPEKVLEHVSRTLQDFNSLSANATLIAPDDQPQSNQQVNSKPETDFPSADTTVITADNQLQSNHKVNFKPTTITRYTEDSAVSQSVRSVTTCDFDSLGKNTTMERVKMKKKKKKHRSKSKEREDYNENKRQECRVVGYPFTELRTGIHGTYSGPVNEIFQPHTLTGEGEFHIQNTVNGSRFQFKGTVWENGSMVSNQLLLFRQTVDVKELNIVSRGGYADLKYSDAKDERAHSAHSSSSSKKKKKHRKKSISGEDSRSSSKKKKRRHKVPPSDHDSGSRSKNNEHEKSGRHENSRSSSEMTTEKQLDPKLVSDPRKNRQSALIPVQNKQDTLHTENNSTSAKELMTSPFEHSLGTVARARSEMIVAANPILAVEATSTLKIHEKAFLQRSNGLWTVAMLADRSMQPINSYRISSKWYKTEEIEKYERVALEESLLFVINLQGGTKIVPVSALS